ncbi:uncharacterized protein LOC9640107 [Selaginella moellendorffii]|nr:uncharacterized protein LOC9640107 [Selaginella moellendorffii]|eukprot:XP_002985753.2 uncharacterized protein LOC9640107 [Selaginella moellendorffii]
MLGPIDSAALLLLLLPLLLGSHNLAAAAAGDHGVQCSRARSRTARHILEEYLLPFVENENYALSPECRLHASNDAFREQEREKQFYHIHDWRCGYCHKIFESEEYLDLHFDNRHSETLNVSRHNCLADLCGALHCDYMETKDKHKFSKNKCSPSVDRNRHLCEKLANSCFPPQQGAQATRLNDFFLRQFCDAHSCKPGKRSYFPRGSGHRGNQPVYYAACFFTVLIVLLFYTGLYIYRRDTQISLGAMKRLSQHSVKNRKKH